MGLLRSISFTRVSSVRLVVLRGTEITNIPLADAIAKTRTIGDDLIALAAGLQPEL